MNFTMKILALSVLLVAMMALALGTEAPPEAEAAPGTAAPAHDNKENADASPDEKTKSDDEDEEEAETTEGEKKHEIAKRAVCRGRGRARSAWFRYGKYRYYYSSSPTTWAQAQRNCQALGGNLASVHSTYENRRIRSWTRGRSTWIGFSDAQQERYWFWIDGTRFNYRNWCRGQPDNYRRKQHCTRTAGSCWDDFYCAARLPYICRRR